MKNLLFIPVFFLSLNVQANGCPGQFDPQSGICSFQGNNGELVQYNTAPPQYNNDTVPAKKIVHKTIHLPPKYGAIASDKKTATIGTSINMDSEVAAKRAAIKSCQNGNKQLSCVIVAFYGNACIAAVGGSQGKKGILFKAVDENPGGYAVKKAMEKCQQSSATDCQVLIEEQCSR